MKRMMMLACSLAIAGCSTSNYLDDRTVPDRPEYGSGALPVPPAPAPHLEVVNQDPTANPAVAVQEQQITGTWTFTVPPTVTRVERKTAEMSQFSLYNGRPGPEDKPFVVITISGDSRAVAESDPETYRVSNQREYALNGSVAHEWTGNTSDGSGFCELLVRKPTGNGDLCHAMAIARTAAERKLALEILASLKWTAAGTTPAAQ